MTETVQNDATLRVTALPAPAARPPARLAWVPKRIVDGWSGLLAGPGLAAGERLQRQLLAVSLALYLGVPFALYDFSAFPAPNISQYILMFGSAWALLPFLGLLATLLLLRLLHDWLDDHPIFVPLVLVAMAIPPLLLSPLLLPLTHTPKFITDVDKLVMDSPAPLQVDTSLGHYPYPQPGILKDREY